MRSLWLTCVHILTLKNEKSLEGEGGNIYGLNISTYQHIFTYNQRHYKSPTLMVDTKSDDPAAAPVQNQPKSWVAMQSYSETDKIHPPAGTSPVDCSLVLPSLALLQYSGVQGKVVLCQEYLPSSARTCFPRCDQGWVRIDWSCPVRKIHAIFGGRRNVAVRRAAQSLSTHFPCRCGKSANRRRIASSRRRLRNLKGIFLFS